MKKLILLISLILGTYLTTLGQEQNDTICFQLDEAKNLLKYAEKGYFCDSLVLLYNKKDSALNSFISIQEIRHNEEIKKLRKNTIFYSIGFGLIGVLIGVLI